MTKPARHPTGLEVALVPTGGDYHCKGCSYSGPAFDGRVKLMGILAVAMLGVCTFGLGFMLAPLVSNVPLRCAECGDPLRVERKGCRGGRGV